jgi:peptide/nickel transport system substrate-binding protein
MRVRRPLAACVIAVLAAVVFAGCGSTSSNDGGGAGAAKANGLKKGPLVINMSLVPSSLDPGLMRGGWGPTANVYATLLIFPLKPIDVGKGIEAQRSDQTAPEGYLAESFEFSEDGKQLRLKLRPGLKFSTGNPLDAPAVVASIKRGIELGATAAFFLNFGNQPDLKVRWEAEDDLTVVAHLSRPEPLSVKYLAQPYTGIVDVKAIEANGGEKADKPNEWITTHSAGAGPYMYSEVRPGTSVTMVPNPNYHGDPPVHKTVIVNFITESSTLLLQARNGAADSTWGLPKEAVSSLEGDACCRILRQQDVTTEFMALPNIQPPFNNKKFRQGLIHAIPYQEISDAVAHGYGRLFYGPFSPAMLGYNEELSPAPVYDLEKAKQLIAESGVKLPVNTDLMVQQGSTDHETIATYTKDALAKVGVNLDIKIVPAAVYSSEEGVYQSGKNKIPLLRADGPAVVDPVYHMDYDQKCNAYSNTSGYCDPRTEKLLAELHRTADETRRQELLDEVTKIWVENYPKIQFYSMDFTEVVSKGLRKWVYHKDLGPRGVEFWEYAE